MEWVLQTYPFWHFAGNAARRSKWSQFGNALDERALLDFGHSIRPVNDQMFVLGVLKSGTQVDSLGAFIAYVSEDGLGVPEIGERVSQHLLRDTASRL
jgi:hypothetical protein